MINTPQSFYVLIRGLQGPGGPASSGREIQFQETGRACFLQTITFEKKFVF